MRLATDGALGVVDVVESMHGTIQRFTLPIGRPPAERTTGATGHVYRTIRGGIDLVGGALDKTLNPWTSVVSAEGSPSPRRDALVAALNGVWGDHLLATGNPLALPMSLRPSNEETTETPHTEDDHLLILAHGLCMADTGWRTSDGHDHGARLADAVEITPLYLQYNSGLPIYHNGRELAALLEVICKRWPRPVRAVSLLGYSMGGLVVRSACHYAELEGYSWRTLLDRIITLGTPHLGAPLERAGTWVEFALNVSPYSAPIARLARRRSAGIANLGHSAVTESTSEFVPLPAGVRCFAIAGSRDAEAAPDRRLGGDGIVPVDSALGRSPDKERSLAFPANHQAVLFDVTHLGLLASNEAFVQMRDWMTT